MMPTMVMRTVLPLALGPPMMLIRRECWSIATEFGTNELTVCSCKRWRPSWISSEESAARAGRWRSCSDAAVASAMMQSSSAMLFPARAITFVYSPTRRRRSIRMALSKSTMSWKRSLQR